MTRMNHKSFLILTLVLVFAMAGTVFAASFSDTSGHWAATYINYAADNKLIEGYENGTFRPDNNITRAEFYTMVNRFAKFTATTPTHFSDVKSGSWYADAVSRAVAAGYIKDATGALYPDRAMDRDEAARIISTIYGLPHNPNPSNGFRDASAISNKGDVGALVARKVLNGYPDGTFKPNGSITRGEFAKILYIAANELGTPKAPTAPVKKPTTSNCPYVGELKEAINRGEDTLRRYHATTSQRTELQRAIDAAKAMVDRSENPLYVNNGTYYVPNRTGIYNTALGTEYIYAGRSFTGEQDFYNYYRGLGYSDSYIGTIWRLAEPRSTYVPVSGYRDFEDFYRAYAATYRYDRAAALRAWQGTSISCPYSREDILAARDRIDRAIGAITGSYRPGLGSIEVRFVDRGSLYARTHVRYGQGARVTPDPYRPGYRFLGWSYTPDGRVVDPSRESIHRDTTFYAVWNDAARTYSVQVVDGVATVKGREVSRAAVGDVVTITATVPKDKEFSDWYSNDIKPANLTKETTTFTMPDRDVKLVAKFKDKTPVTPAPTPTPEKTYTVTVNGGAVASPEKAKKGELVTLVAPAVENKRFVKWTSTDVAEINNKTESKVTFTMPEKNVTVTAVYEDATPVEPPKPVDYTVTVEGGKAEPNKATSGTSIHVTANPPKEGLRFSHWESTDAVQFQDAKNVETTFTMPNKDVTVKAVYVEEVYTVTVDGEKKTEAPKGASVKVEAEVAEGKEFVEWKSEDVTFADPKSPNTTFTMPAKNVVVTSVTKEKSTPVDALNEAVAEALQGLKENPYFSLAYDKEGKKAAFTLKGDGATKVSEVKDTGIVKALSDVIASQGIKTIDGHAVEGKSTAELKAVLLEILKAHAEKTPETLKDLEGKGFGLSIEGDKDGAYNLNLTVTFGK